MAELASLSRLPTQSAKITLLQMVIQSRTLMQVLSIASRGELLSESAAAGSYLAKVTSISSLISPTEWTRVLVDGHASTFLSCSYPVGTIKFLKMASSVKRQFYFMFHGFTFTIESDIQIKKWVCQCKG